MLDKNNWIQCACISAAFSFFAGLKGYQFATFDMAEAIAEKEKSEFVTKPCSEKFSVTLLNPWTEIIDPAVLRKKYSDCVTEEAKIAAENTFADFKYSIGLGAVYAFAGGAVAVSAFRNKRKAAQGPAPK